MWNILVKELQNIILSDLHTMVMAEALQKSV